MKAHHLMTSNLSVVTPDEPIARAAKIMRGMDVGIVPVVADRLSMRPQGVLTDRDIAVRCVAQRHDANCLVRDHMTGGHLETVRADASFHDVIERMEERQLRRMLVLGDDDRLAGIIGQADIALKLGPKRPIKVQHMLERISEPAPGVRSRRWRARGRRGGLSPATAALPRQTATGATVNSNLAAHRFVDQPSNGRSRS